MSKNITVNGTTYDASYVSAPLADGSGNATFRESSELSLQSKSVTPTESQQTVTPASDYFALDKVVVGAIPSEYVKPTSKNSGGELMAGSTIPAGTYFTGEATVPSGSGETNPIISLNTDGVVDESVLKIVAAGTTIGKDSDGADVTLINKSFVFHPSQGTDYLYVFYGTNTGVNSEMLNITIMDVTSSRARGCGIKDNATSPLSMQWSPVTIDGQTWYYIDTNLWVPCALYVGYAIPYSAIGWS